MTDRTENKQNLTGPGNLTEFENDTAIGLAPFEDGSGIMLDEFSYPGSNMLTEFENPIEFINLDESRDENPDTPDETPEPETPPTEPEAAPDESDEPAKEPGTSDEDELVGDESEFIEPVDRDALDKIRDVGLVDEKPGKFTPEPEVDREPANPVIGFVCSHALNISDLVDMKGWMHSHPIVRLIEVPCAGMVKSKWLDMSLESGASGAFVVSCSVENCYHRRGAGILKDRWNCTREPFMEIASGNERIRLIQNYRAAKGELIKEMEKFIFHAGRLDWLEKEKIRNLEAPPTIIEGELM